MNVADYITVIYTLKSVFAVTLSLFIPQ